MPYYIFFNIAILLRCVDSIVAEEVAAEDGMQDGPVPKDQLENLAADVCARLFFELNTDCENEFTNSTTEISSKASTVQFTCRAKSRTKYTLEPSREPQLVILVPDRDKVDIRHSIFRGVDETGVIEKLNDSVNYTFWTTTLHYNGSHNEWRKGPNLPPWSGNGINFTIEDPSFEYIKERKRYNTTFKIHIFGEISPCTTFNILNDCINDELGLSFFEIPITPNVTANETTMDIAFPDDLPINNDCVLKVFSNGDLETPTSEKIYFTPKPDNFAEKPEMLTLDAEATIAGWNIIVTWAQPKRYPTRYHLILRTSDEIYHDHHVPGEATNYTFLNVEGKEGTPVNVTIWSITPNDKKKAVILGRLPSRPSYQVVIITGTWSVVLTLATAATGAIVWWRRRRMMNIRKRYFSAPDPKLPKECLMEACPEPGVEDGWELKSERLLLHEVIGEGAFGVVRRGTLAPGGREVAVKMLKEFPTLEEIRSFRAEMDLMKSVGAHPHIVSLVGCCSGRKPLIVAEYCSRGDLLSFLRCSWDLMVSKRNAKYYNNNLEGSDYRNDLFKKQNDPKFPPLVVNKLYDLQGLCDSELTALDLLSFCRQIAMGMEFLASNRVVHRDLAARNILVTGDRTLKIADFGLSRDVYQENQYKQKGNGKMPVKWMALESLTHRIYTTQSDVWSFGVVIWEVVTVGGAPYPEVAAARLPRLLRAGYRMPRPNNCSKQLYDLMMSCWRARPRDRPTFAELHCRLDELLNSACADEYLSLELDYEPPPTPKPQRYIRMILRGNRVWARGESYERPLKAPQSNHYTTPPHSNNYQTLNCLKNSWHPAVLTSEQK